MIQEIKLSCMQDFWAKSFWSNEEIDYSYSMSREVSGGIITLWKKGKVKKVCSFKSEGYLGIKFLWKNHIYYLVNAYSSCNINEKKLLSGRLLELKELFRDGEWIIGGNFNVIKNHRERKWGRLYEDNTETNLIAEFIEKIGLVDIPCKGKKFSWYSADGKSMSRIDHFLL
ncbi:unnamed protein product [Vicia faba]|uniref:Endonuclease/exonuclease/phosphatase domain-containing protein n=1 Tax=Vicia faba TaxID=3906 RepID=A0AAV0ZFE5_VICFA|nr:unnamed protein product [Vicia faba]